MCPSGTALSSINKGDVVVVCGPSGSGKTSLVRAGLLPQLMKSLSSVAEPV
eukprot:gene39431-63113_t